ncbi:MAG: hypothetical protein ACRDJK_09855 [Actinomycetota bacterium]
MTTRRHYPGRHRIDLLINGVAHPLAEFEVRPSPWRLRGPVPAPA